MATFQEQIVISATDNASAGIRSAMLSVEGLREVQERASQAFFAGVSAISGWVQEALSAETAYVGLQSALQNNILLQQESIGLYADNTAVLGENSAAVAMQAEELKNLAYELQNSSVYAGDNIVQMQAALAQYGLNTAQIKEMTPALVDLASAYEMSTGKQISLVDVAKRYNDAQNGSKEALKDFGINLKDVEGNMVSYGTLQGRITEAAEGQAKVFASTATGAIRSMQNAWGDLQRDLGQAVLPILMEINNVAIKPLIGFITGLSAETKQAAAVAVIFATGLAGVVAVAASLSIAISAVNLAMLPWIATFAGITAAAYVLYEALLMIISALERLSGITIQGVMEDILSAVGADEGATIDESAGGTQAMKNKKVYGGFEDFFNENEQGATDTAVEEAY